MLVSLERPLISNGYTLSNSPMRLGHLVPSHADTSLQILREQYEAQGYLWLKNILDRKKVLSFRQRFFTAFAATGLLVPGSDPQEGIYAGDEIVEDKQITRKILQEVVRWAAYEEFCLSEPIVDFLKAFLQSPVYLHKRKLIRYTKPYDPSCTGGHYDMVYLRAGSDRFCSTWIPIGDIPLEMGGLVYLEGSHSLGQRLEKEFRLKNADLPSDERIKAYNKNMSSSGWISKDLAALADLVDGRWLVADYEAGDIVIHSPYILHASTRNESTEGRLRLSTDIRYQRVSDEIDFRWSKDWSPDDML